MNTRRGFSIIEIVIVAAIIAGALIMALPLLNDLRGVPLSNETSALVRLIRGTYSEAALKGLTLRIVFEMKTDKDTNVETTAYWVEASKEEARAGETVKEEEDGGLHVGLDDKEKAEKEKYRKKPSFLPLKDRRFKRHDVPAPVRISGIWVEGMRDRVREGTVYLYFSPMGFTQRAQISVADKNSVMVVLTEPLTGGVAIENEEKPVS